MLIKHQSDRSPRRSGGRPGRARERQPSRGRLLARTSLTSVLEETQARLSRARLLPAPRGLGGAMYVWPSRCKAPVCPRCGRLCAEHTGAWAFTVPKASATTRGRRAGRRRILAKHVPPVCQLVTAGRQVHGLCRPPLALTVIPGGSYQRSYLSGEESEGQSHMGLTQGPLVAQGQSRHPAGPGMCPGEAPVTAAAFEAAR